jgi:Ankyrin repeats (many copies)/Ankyrin repeat
MTRSFRALLRAVVAGELDTVRLLLDQDGRLATVSADKGARRGGASSYFFEHIQHYLYEGDTALHMAAAAFQQPIAALLVAHGADCHARNRRRAQPLHYACDTNHWDPSAQAEVITYLIAIGSDPNARTMDGVTPLHRAVRTRSFPAVKALLEGGADPTLRNKAGSTPRRLARFTTGRGGSGSERAREQQAAIARILDERTRRSIPI